MNADHGGDIYAAARSTGRPLRRITDFSASINPLGPSPRALKAIVSALQETAHYPEPSCMALREALAKKHGLTIDHFAVGNGSTEFIHLLPFALAIDRAFVIGPTFSEYARAVGLRGGQVLSLNAERDDAYQPPIQRAIEMIQRSRRRFDALILCNPNSPTGRSIDRDAVCAVVQAIGRHQGWAIIDETFIDYCEQRSMIPALERYPHLVVLKSFTKFFAMPGLRLGYLAGNPKVIETIRAAQPPWSVNTLAQVAALASMKDRAYISRTLRTNAQERPRLIEALASIPGLTVYPSDANFLLAEVAAPHSASRLAESLRQQGLLIRDCSSIPGLTERTIRIAVRTSSENRRLVTALRRALQSAGTR
jgi:threonine-phosphate decarboxylase